MGEDVVRRSCTPGAGGGSLTGGWPPGSGRGRGFVGGLTCFATSVLRGVSSGRQSALLSIALLAVIAFLLDFTRSEFEIIPTTSISGVSSSSSPFASFPSIFSRAFFSFLSLLRSSFVFEGSPVVWGNLLFLFSLLLAGFELPSCCSDVTAPFRVSSKATRARWYSAKSTSSSSQSKSVCFRDTAFLDFATFPRSKAAARVSSLSETATATTERPSAPPLEPKGIFFLPLGPNCGLSSACSSGDRSDFLPAARLRIR